MDYKTTIVSFKHQENPETLSPLLQQLQPEIERMQQALKQGYNTPYASLALPYDYKYNEQIRRVVKEKRKLNIKAIIVIGIGGSHLGTLAVEQAVLGLLYNDHTPDVAIYYVDTVDSAYLADLRFIIERHLFDENENILVNVISKSGNTTETIANFQIFLEMLQQYFPDDWQNYVVVTTDENSPLWQLAKQEQFTCLPIPAKVGGRYSVFSAVGLFPLEFVGVDTWQLREGACHALATIQTSTSANYAAVSAALLAHYYQQGYNIHNTFIFAQDLQGFGAWYRQLLGESIGKEFDLQGKKVNVGLVPLTSIGTTDLHSVGQLYLSGNHHIFTTFVTVYTPGVEFTVPRLQGYEKLVEHIQGKTIDHIMDAVTEGTQQAYTAAQLPYVTWHLREKSAWSIGCLLQYKMLETIYLASLLNVNPFDQPNVESYKHATRKILADE